MICQQDKTFCASDCLNTQCHRHKSHCKVQPRGFELPIAQADFSSECEDYMPSNSKHPSHETRFSDASTFDEICVNCGARDIAGGGWGELAYPCKHKPPRGKEDAQDQTSQD